MQTISTLLLLVFFSMIFLSYGNSQTVANLAGAGYCYNNNSTNDYINLGDSTAFRFGISDFSLECWFYFDGNLQLPGLGLINKRDSVTPFSQYSLSFCGPYPCLSGNTDRVMAFIRTERQFGFTRDRVVVSNPLRKGWHHVAMVNDYASHLELYLDGVSMGTNSTNLVGLPVNGTNSPLRIGSSTFTGAPTNGAFIDKIDEVRIWNVARTPTEIREHMCQKLKGNESGLVAYYRFDEAGDNTCLGGGDVCDGTSNGYHGTKYSENSIWEKSGAAIGDTSVFHYTNNWTGTILSLDHPQKQDSIVVKNIVSPSTPTGVHVYRVDEQPNTGSAVTCLDSNDRYIGVFTVANSNGDTLNYSLEYYHIPNPFVNPGNQSSIHLLKRENNSICVWRNANSIPSTPGPHLLVVGDTIRKEYILGIPKVLDYTQSNSRQDSLTSHSSNVIIYPNPVDNELKIDFFNKLDQRVKFEVFDYLGKKLISTTSMKNKGENLLLIPTSTLATGHYFLRLINLGKSEVLQFYVQH